MHQLTLNQRVNAFYGTESHPGEIVAIYDFIANNKLAKVFMVKMDNGTHDTFALNFIKPIIE